jgi:23S rRNA (guanosine2251-2'-O)-methyltransferase
VSYLTDRKSVIETLKAHPGQARRLWIESGHERALDEPIRLAREQGVSFRVLPREAFHRKFKDAHSHLCLERDDFNYIEPEVILGQIHTQKDPLLCAFDGIFDPQNLGNIIRSAACFGVAGIILPKDRSCGVNDTVMGISRGAIEHVKMTRVVNLARFLDALKEAGVFCYGMDEGGEKPLWEIDLKGPVCLVFGSEEGLRRLTREKCDGLVRIPTAGTFPSLNVATSLALSLYEAERQKRRL